MSKWEEPKGRPKSFRSRRNETSEYLRPCNLQLSTTDLLPQMDQGLLERMAQNEKDRLRFGIWLAPRLKIVLFRFAV